MPESFTVDISVLVNLGDSILVKDINVPENVEILSDPEELVLFASSMKAEAEEEEEEIVAEDKLDETGEPEVIEKGKKEEEE